MRSRKYFSDRESRESHESGEVLFARFVIQPFSKDLSLRSFAAKKLPMFGTFAPLRLSGQLIAVAFMLCCSVQAELRMPVCFADNMVLFNKEGLPASPFTTEN